MDECARWLARLAADEKAVRHDLVGFMLGTGVRAGEALGLAWDEVDLVGIDMLVDGAVRRTYMVKVDWTVCRVKADRCSVRAPRRPPAAGRCGFLS
ncbi:MAG: hypothetical protein ACRDSZ_14430 [Pseudonocardiaceae bacterium]